MADIIVSPQCQEAVETNRTERTTRKKCVSQQCREAVENINL